MSEVFELHIVDTGGRVCTVSIWDDQAATNGLPVDLARLQRDADVAGHDGEVVDLYTYPTPDLRKQTMAWLANIKPTATKGSP
ncbi:MAG TPA: hypothetical protein VMZ00_09340 [Sporichthya sp.]|nr:hypothetical protein [Sporichthya sp.]